MDYGDPRNYDRRSSSHNETGDHDRGIAPRSKDMIERYEANKDREKHTDVSAEPARPLELGSDLSEAEQNEELHDHYVKIPADEYSKTQRIVQLAAARCYHEIKLKEANRELEELLKDSVAGLDY